MVAHIASPSLRSLRADIMAENAALTMRYLTTGLYDCLGAAILSAMSPDEVRRCCGRGRVDVVPPSPL